MKFPISLQLHFNRLFKILDFYAGFAFGLAILISLPWLYKNRWTRFMLFLCFVVIIAILSTMGAMIHYAAPISCLFFLLIIKSLRHLNSLEFRGNLKGNFLFYGILLTVLVSTIWQIHAPISQRGITPNLGSIWGKQRADIIKRLETTHGKHLVLVIYKEGALGGRGWLSNEAVIDQAKVVWAKSIGAERDAELMAYFRDRHVWLLHIDNVHDWASRLIFYRESPLPANS